jgi:hypothetical protein
LCKFLKTKDELSNDFRLAIIVAVFKAREILGVGGLIGELQLAA